MEMSTDRFKIIRYLVEIEDLANELYTFFAEKFPEESEFWFAIAREEKDHAAIIRMLGAGVAEGQSSFDDRRFTLEEIETSVEWARQKVAGAKQNKINIEEALSLSFEFEQNVLDRSFFEVFVPEHKSVGDFISGVVAATKRHRDSIKKKLEEYRHT
jgi:rubrerythrin